MLAFATEFMARQKELGPKSLKALLGTTGPPRRRTHAEERSAMLQFAKMYGLTVKTKTPA